MSQFVLMEEKGGRHVSKASIALNLTSLTDNMFFFRLFRVKVEGRLGQPLEQSEEFRNAQRYGGTICLPFRIQCHWSLRRCSSKFC